jgi:ribosomal protein S27AE
MAYQIAPDYRSSSRRDNRRIVELCNGCRNTEDGRKDKQDGMSFDRNRLSSVCPERTVDDLTHCHHAFGTHILHDIARFLPAPRPHQTLADPRSALQNFRVCPPCDCEDIFRSHLDGCWLAGRCHSTTSLAPFQRVAPGETGECGQSIQAPW